MSREFGYHNPYYNPKECGLELVAQIDMQEPDYSFDIRAVWRDEATGKLYTGRDSGCSCPAPFEDVKSLAGLERLLSVKDLVQERAKEITKDYGSPPSAEEWGRFIDVVIRAVEKAKAA